MVEEYLPADLHDWIRYNNINLTESCAKYIFKQVVLGINHLHNSNIIHRDIASNFPNCCSLQIKSSQNSLFERCL